MEIIDISGYVAEEKLAIAEKYLVPQVDGLLQYRTVQHVLINCDLIEYRMCSRHPQLKLREMVGRNGIQLAQT
jgi:hypothetical protein